jgi:insertion element IS1 protein InsB
MWSFIGKKAEPWWVWTAPDSRTRQVVGMAVGDRDEFTARCLWESLPPGHRERAIVATDLLPIYEAMVPERWHATGGKGSGLTNHIERFFGTVWTSPRIVDTQLRVYNHPGRSSNGENATYLHS